MNRNRPERCKDCGAPAAVRMQGVSVCGRCGLERSSRGTNHMSWRTALLGILSSGFLAKMLLGAVAVAAFGGVAVSLPADAPEAPPASAQTLLQTDAPFVETDLVQPVLADDALLERVHAYVASVQEWGDCVSEAARDHSGERFDPKEACGDTPIAATHGLDSRPFPPSNAADAPGQQDAAPGKSADAPGQQDAAPGKSADAPGQQDAAPGKSADAPGQQDAAPGKSADAPGQQDAAPGR